MQSIFSMPVLNWDAKSRDIATEHFWVYWAITIPLTFVVMSFSLLWMVRDQLKERLKVKKEQRPQRKERVSK